MCVWQQCANYMCNGKLVPCQHMVCVCVCVYLHLLSVFSIEPLSQLYHYPGEDGEPQQFSKQCRYSGADMKTVLSVHMSCEFLLTFFSSKCSLLCVMRPHVGIHVLFNPCQFCELSLVRLSELTCQQLVRQISDDLITELLYKANYRLTTQGSENGCAEVVFPKQL